MKTEKEITDYIEESLHESKTCKLIDGSEIDLQYIDLELIKCHEYFKEENNKKILLNIKKIIEDYGVLVKELNNETDKLLNISNTISILEKYKNNDSIKTIPASYLLSFRVTNKQQDKENTENIPYLNCKMVYEYDSECCERNEDDSKCKAEISKEDFKTENDMFENSEELEKYHSVDTYNHRLFNYFSKEDTNTFIDSQINCLKVLFKNQKKLCETIKKELDKYRDSVVTIDDDYEKLIDFLKSTNSSIKYLLNKNEEL